MYIINEKYNENSKLLKDKESDLFIIYKKNKIKIRNQWRKKLKILIINLMLLDINSIKVLKNDCWENKFNKERENIYNVFGE